MSETTRRDLLKDKPRVAIASTVAVAATQRVHASETNMIQVARVGCGSRSGLFGWGDDSECRVYVYDREGRATDRYSVRSVLGEGKAYAEVRIPGGYSATIVRESGRS